MKTYHVKALWDAEAGVYYSQNDIPGLNIEAETLREFIEIAEELAPQIARSQCARVRRQSQAGPPDSGAGLRVVSGDYYRDLVKLLREAGCQFVRAAKRSHTANSVLKDAGLPKAF
jgi:hypothetical protein